jgi:hypothetical protein
MSPPIPVARQVRVEKLWPLLRRLAQALWSRGFKDEPLKALFGGKLNVRCDGCDSVLSAEELLVVLDTADGTTPSNAKMQRLSQGYCVKPACNSYFYRITLQPEEGIDWNALLAEAENPPSEGGQNQTDEAKPTRTKTPLSADAKVRIAIGMAVVVLLVLVRQWYFNGRIPFVTKSFEATAPSSVPAAALDLNNLPPDSRRLLAPTDGSGHRPTNGFGVGAPQPRR